MRTTTHRKYSSRFPVLDEARRTALDPTRTGKARARLNTILRQSASKVRTSLSSALVENDVLGLRNPQVNGWRPHEQQERLTMLITAAYGLAMQQSPEVNGVIRAIYEQGWRSAYREAGYSGADIPPPPADGPEPHIKLLANDIAGILTATRQNIFRSVSMGIMSGKTNQQINQDVSDIITTVMLPRFKLAVSTVSVTAYNHAKLDSYQRIGIDRVGVIAEQRPEPLSREERKKFPGLVTLLAAGVVAGTVLRGAERGGDRRRGVGGPTLPEPPDPFAMLDPPRPPPPEPGPDEGGEPPEPPDIPIVPSQGPDEESLVTILTAGDDRVCDICEDFEGESYTLQEARSLIPAHINCRCVVVPAPGFIPPKPEDWARL